MNWKITHRIRRNRRERGAILAAMAIGMTSLVLAAGLAIDISHFYTVGTELQNAADAAALAGATALNHTGPGIHDAANRAVVAMNNYEINHASVALAKSDVTYAVNLTDFDNGLAMNETAAATSPQNIRFVKVSIPPKAVGVTLAKSVLGSSFNIARSAVAGQSVGLNNFNDFSKLVLVQDGNPGRIASGTNQKLTTVGAGCANNDVYTKGCTYDISLAPPCDARASTYEVIKQTNDNFPSSDTNKQVICPVDTAGGVETCPSGGQEYTIDSHIDPLYIRQAFNSLFDVYAGGMTPANFPPDLNIRANITYSQYKSGSPSTAPTNPGLMDRRLLVLPIMNIEDVTNWDAADFRVNVNKFGVFFVVKRPCCSNPSTGDLRLEYITDNVVVGGGSYDPFVCSTNSNSQVTVPVLYR